MATFHENQAGAATHRTRWIVIGAIALAIIGAVVLVIVYSGGGGSGGGGGY